MYSTDWTQSSIDLFYGITAHPLSDLRDIDFTFKKKIFGKEK